MRPARLALATALIVVVSACSGGGSTASSSPAASPSSAAAPSQAAQRIEVKLTDALTMEPAQMSVKAGETVTFVVTNTGATDHEFYLGDEAAQAAHEMEMVPSLGPPMSMDESMGVTLKPGETKELTHTFEKAGEVLAGCHVTGHYPAGMKATITVIS